MLKQRECAWKVENEKTIQNATAGRQQVLNIAQEQTQTNLFPELAGAIVPSTPITGARQVSVMLGRQVVGAMMYTLCELR